METMERINNFELVVAMDMDGCIGKSNSIPWHIPEDLKYFKELTENSIVIMGRLTFESLPYGRPLKNRLNIVISTKLDNTYNYSNVIVTDMIDVFNVIEKYRLKYPKVFIIGGAQIYDLFIKYCNKLHITHVYIKATKTYDTEKLVYFNTSLLNDFTLINTSDILTSKNNLSYMFYTYIRV